MNNPYLAVLNRYYDHLVNFIQVADDKVLEWCDRRLELVKELDGLWKQLSPTQQHESLIYAENWYKARAA